MPNWYFVRINLGAPTDTEMIMWNTPPRPWPDHGWIYDLVETIMSPSKWQQLNIFTLSLTSSKVQCVQVSLHNDDNETMPKCIQFFVHKVESHFTW